MHKYIVTCWKNFSLKNISLIYDKNDKISYDTDSIKHKAIAEGLYEKKAVKYYFDKIEEASAFYESKKTSCTLKCILLKNIFKPDLKKSIGVECDILVDLCSFEIQYYIDGVFSSSNELGFYSEELFVERTDDNIRVLNKKPLKYYKKYDKEFIGISEIASVVTLGCKSNSDAVPELLSFGEDGSYYAYIVDGNAEIGSHYKLEKSFKHWLRIYDDGNLTYHTYADVIHIYRTGNFGVIIQVIDYGSKK